MIVVYLLLILAALLGRLLLVRHRRNLDRHEMLSNLRRIARNQEMKDRP